MENTKPTEENPYERRHQQDMEADDLIERALAILERIAVCFEKLTDHWIKKK